MVEFSEIYGKCVRREDRTLRCWNNCDYVIILGTKLKSGWHFLSNSLPPSLCDRSGAFFFLIINMVFGNLSAVELFINERAIFMWVKDNSLSVRVKVHMCAGSAWLWKHMSSHFLFLIWLRLVSSCVFIKSCEKTKTNDAFLRAVSTLSVQSVCGTQTKFPIVSTEAMKKSIK